MWLSVEVIERFHLDNWYRFRIYSEHAIGNNEPEVVFCSSEILVYRNLACPIIGDMVSAHVYIEIYNLLTDHLNVHIQVMQ